MPTVKASEEGLEKIKQARERLTQENGWAVDNEQWLDEASKYLPLAKAGKSMEPGTVSIGTWKRFLGGQGVKATSFRAFCTVLGLNWEEVFEPSPQQKTQDLTESQPVSSSSSSRQDWGEAPDISAFYGRTNELDTLEQWVLHDRCRLVAVLGIGGIGKTTLAVKLGMGGIGKSTLSIKLAKQIEGEFEYVIWRSLLNAPPVEDLLVDLIKFLSNQQEANLSDNLSNRILKLLHYLRQHRCLLILDNVESILRGRERAGQYRDEYENYGALFKHIGEALHQSCLLLTSREKPHEIATLEGVTKPVRSLPLGGLDESEGRKIFDEYGKFSGSDNEWEELIEFYNGNPLALEIVARHIQWIFNGNISQFLREGRQVFGDLRDLLDWHFNRLSDAEREIMYWLAINREPVSIAELKNDILSSTGREKVPETLELLERRLPLEKIKKKSLETLQLLDEQMLSAKEILGFTLQPVLIEYATEKLIQAVHKEIESQDFSLLDTHALVKAVTKEYVRESQVLLILQPILYQIKEPEEQLRVSLKNIQGQAEFLSGYAAGNILNLLCCLDRDLNNCNFSKLTIRQAYLKNIYLNNVNFTSCHFILPALTQTFGEISSVTFSPDCTLLATTDAKGEVRLWQTLDGQLLAVYQGHTNWVRTVAFSPNGKLLASGGDDRTIHLWNIATCQCIHVFQGHTDRIYSVAFSPDGETLISGSADRTVRLWNISDHQCLYTFKEHSDWVRAVNFSTDGKLIASASYDQTIRFWSIDSNQSLHTFCEHSSWVYSVVFSPDGARLASSSDDQTIRIWDVVTRRCLYVLQGHTNRVLSVAFSPDGETLISCSEDQTIRIWDISSCQCVCILQGHTNSIRSIAISSNGETLASGSSDQTIRLWDVATRRCLYVLQGYRNSVMFITYSPSGMIVASGNYDRTISIWDINTCQCLQILRGHTSWVYSITFDSNGKFLASGSADNTVRLWSITTYQCLHVLQGHTSWVWSIAFNPKAQILASGSDDKTVILWNTDTYQRLHVLQGHTNRVRCVAFSPTEDKLASGGDDQTVRIWDITTYQCSHILHNHTNWVLAIVFSPNGQMLASGSEDETIVLWDVSTYKYLHILRGHTGPVNSVSFSPDGKILASGSADQTIRLWDSITYKCLHVFEGHAKSVQSVAFSLDGKNLVSGSEDGTINLWSLETRSCLATMRSPRPYEGTNITGATGLTEVQRTSFKVLGAIEEL
ncbi:MAG: NACHT domain-containing protein [Pegethrix bostrychoides GSE-TBD4-15B]|uniref:NACHT domain-containing protein n=1 Tax=Pegethrix bostrychoides GSE-TBD4-15B TaxID=2839662 RepID=A0A951P8J2_9CYAN|nr:NACHT domain-containing protein [Pegethrix bostrychoides GSE-TBD4-15B]